MCRPNLFVLALTVSAVAADPRGDQPDARPSTPQEQLAKFHVPPGFEVQLVAAEPEIQKPMNLNFDAAGRLWVTGSELYPWPAKVDALGQPIANFDKVWANTAGSFDAKKAPAPPERATDTVRVLSDFGPDGRARKVSVFADGLNIPIGIQPLPRGTSAIAALYELPPAADPNPAEPKPAPVGDRHLARQPKGDSVIVYSIPNIWLLTDWDGDGKADKREPLYTGFDFRDTHGMSSNFYYWIDGWIYGCHGFRNRSEVKDRHGKVTVFDSGNTYRFRPDGSAIEYWSHGQTNPFGLAFDELGNLYSADSHSKPVMLLLRGGYYEGIGKQHDGLGFAPRITEDDHGSSGIAGIAYYADDKFPEEYRGNLFNGNPVTRRINRAKLEWHGSTPKAIRQPDFLTCDDPWFRPIQVKLGPDGALYIADFYNPIIGHYEAPLADPRRDHTHGRIWRVVWKSNDKYSTAKPLPDLAALDTAHLVQTLGDSNLIVRTLATHELVERIGKPAGEVLADGLDIARERILQLRSSGEEKQTFARLDPHKPALISSLLTGHALWVLERLGNLGSENLKFAYLTRGREDENRVWQLPVHARRIYRERSEMEPDQFKWEQMMVGGYSNFDGQPMGLRAGVENLGIHHSPKNLLELLVRWQRVSSEDLALIHAIRIALRDNLLATGAYQTAATIADGTADKPMVRADLLKPRFAEALAEVSLGVRNQDSAEFLLAHLRRTKFSTPRAGEYLKHAALHLPAERFGEVAGLAEELNDAPLPQKLALAEGLGQARRERKLELPKDAAAWVQGVTLEALKSDDAAMIDRAIAAVRDAKTAEKVEPLRAIVLRAGEHGQRRAAALEALMNLPEGASIAALALALADPSSMTLRTKAADLLASTTGEEARAALLAALPTASQELAVSIAIGLAKSRLGAVALLQAIEEGKASPTLLRQKAVAAALEKSTEATDQLAGRLAALTKDLPPEDARLDKVIAERAELFRTKPGNAYNGSAQFQKHCAVCHRYSNVSQSNVGPNLDGVSARGAHRLLEDILDPNRNVDPAFRQTILETQDGQTFAGANLREQGEALLLTDASGRDVTVPKSAIKTQTPSRLSLMPPAFEAQLTPDQLNDLLAYLLAL